jgi:flavin-dependent dehydrogenase
MADSTHDVAIIGAGPAGATAAILLARAGRNVVLLEKDNPRRMVPCAGWLSAKADGLLKELGCMPGDCGTTSISQVTFYNADLTKRSSPQLKGPIGHLVHRPLFEETLTRKAVEYGAKVLQGEEARDVRLNESSVAIRLPSISVQSRLLILAIGRSPDLLARLGFPLRGPQVCTWAAQVDVPADASGAEARAAVVLGLDNRGSFGFHSRGNGRCTLSVHCVGEATQAVPTLVHLCKLAHAHGLMPRDLSAQAEQTKPILSPAGLALDLDTHVAKHTLLVGDAGGFVAAASNEGIYPAMWSAQIAAVVMDRALANPYSQDELMSFDAQWRMQLADHLRSPHTDIRFLLPLIFSNQAMADRMAAAFFFGENI